MGSFPKFDEVLGKIILLVVSLWPRLRARTKTSVPLYKFPIRNPLNQSSIFALHRTHQWFHVEVLTIHIKEANISKITWGFSKTNVAISFPKHYNKYSFSSKLTYFFLRKISWYSYIAKDSIKPLNKHPL